LHMVLTSYGSDFKVTKSVDNQVSSQEKKTIKVIADATYI